MKVIRSAIEMAAASDVWRGEGRSIVLVPTMGYLHQGHRELLRAGKKAGDVLVLSVFVNPTQFSPGEDYEAYPRDLERDLEAAREEGVDAVFAPGPEEVYPEGFSTSVEVEGLSDRLCGRFRPGHFRGVATVVLKLFNMVRPHSAVFGKKDYQQYIIIKRMVRDLDLDVEIVGVETVRDADGVATSSRNAYLSEDERRAARCIPRALAEAAELVSRGVRDTGGIIEKMKKIVENEPLAVIEYIDICDPETLEGTSRVDSTALAAVAVRIGKARLIDNRLLGAD